MAKRTSAVVPGVPAGAALGAGLHVSRVEVVNYRNFERFLLDPFPPHAVIVGENGVGKSNLLQAMRLVLDPRVSDASRVLRPEDVWSGDPAGLAGGTEVTVSVDICGFDDDDPAKAALSDCLVGVDPYVARLNYRFAPSLRSAGGHDTGTGGPLTPDDYEVSLYARDDDTADSRRARRAVSMRVLPALRDAESDLRAWSTNPLRSLVEELAIGDALLARTVDDLGRAMDALSADPEVTDLAARLTGRLGAMAGARLDVEPTLGFASSKKEDLVRSVRLYVDAARTRGVADTSLGGANVLYLSLLLEALARRRAAAGFVGMVVAVEEPEAHLHPTMQRRLFGYLLRQEPSLVLTTHSPHIAAVTPIGSFVSLTRDTAGGATVGRTTAGLGLTGTKCADVERYLDVSRAEVLFASAVILVEGVSEVYLLAAVAEAAEFDLDEHGVVVASVDGTDFDPYTTFLGPTGLDLPTFVLTDGDASVATTGANAGDRTEPGLRRGARLVRDQAAREELLAAIGDLPDSDTYEADRTAVSEQLREEGIHVGTVTLELDMCQFFGDELLAAYKEVLPRASLRIRRMKVGIDNERQDEPGTDARTQMLEDVEHAKKGRFAQRVAAHVASLDLGTVVRDELGLDPDDDVDTYDGLGRSAYLLECLDAVSRRVRVTGLLPVVP